MKKTMLLTACAVMLTFNVDAATRNDVDNVAAPAELQKLAEKNRIEKEPLIKELVQPMTNRFLKYVRVYSPSIDTNDLNSFPLSDGQIEMAKVVENDLKDICKYSNIEIYRSEYGYVYVKIPSNLDDKKVPSMMFMAHLDVTPDVPCNKINPIVHENYDGGVIKLPAGITLSMEDSNGAHLKNCVGKTIITSDGNSILSADCKSGCTILVTIIERVLANPKLAHGDLYFVFSQAEEVGRAADRLEIDRIGGGADIVIDVDGDSHEHFSTENFTAAMRVYRFRGNNVHPGDGFKHKYGDALTAASHFIGQLPPSKHPSFSKGKQGYIHCYSMDHPVDSLGKRCEEDYFVKVRIRYFDKNEGDTIRLMLDDAVKLTRKSYPWVEVVAAPEIKQYDNVAYSTYPGVKNLIVNSGLDNGLVLRDTEVRGGTTASSMVAKGLRGGPCIHSGAQAEHSVYEWTCIEDMALMVNVGLSAINRVALGETK